MDEMKRYLLGFLMLTMLTPSLACAMAFCPMETTQTPGVSCHESNDETAAPMLALDCMGVDLFQQDVNNDIQPDQSIKKIDYAWADLLKKSQNSAKFITWYSRPARMAGHTTITPLHHPYNSKIAHIIRPFLNG